MCSFYRYIVHRIARRRTKLRPTVQQHKTKKVLVTSRRSSPAQAKNVLNQPNRSSSASSKRRAHLSRRCALSSTIHAMDDTRNRLPPTTCAALELDMNSAVLVDPLAPPSAAAEKRSSRMDPRSAKELPTT